MIDIAGATNEKGEIVPAGSYDPAEDVKFLEIELDQWYLGILKKGWEKFARTVVQEKQQIHIALAKQLSGLKVTEALVQESIDLLGFDKEKPQQWTEDQLLALAVRLRKATKPMIIACNKIDVSEAEKNFVRLQKQFSNETFVRCSAESELALKEAGKNGKIKYVAGDKDFQIPSESTLNDAQKKALQFIQSNILEKFGTTGVQEVLEKAVFEKLGYIAIYPGGANKLEDKEGRPLPDCFLMPPKSTALDFAYKLHTDFGKNFIRAIDVKTKKAVGKEYLLKHRDVLEIVSGR